MATHWTEKRRAVSALGRALRERRWELYGWRDDESDSMTDYYSPESWTGVAVRDGFVACVAVSSYDVQRSGRDEIGHRQLDVGRCPRCEESGKDPSGWTLAAARTEPRRFHVAEMVIDAELSGQKIATADQATATVRYSDGSTRRPGLPDVVSPLPFIDGGALACRRCHGKGRLYTTEEFVRFTWPTFQANPPGATWHVEHDGKIVAKGSGVFAICRSYEPDPTRLSNLIGRIEAVTTGGTRDEPPESVELDGGVSVRASSMNANNVEVLFGEKPPAEILSELKSARFRWARTTGCWYGPRARLPRRYAPALEEV